MKTFREKLYLSTIDDHAPLLAKQYHLGIELCQFCDTTNLDEHLAEAEPQIHDCLNNSERFVLHGPISELSPATIDPMILDVVKKRFRQAASLSMKYGVKRMVVHSGHVPILYFKEWFVARSIPFWKEFLSELPEDFELLYENVMDEDPYSMLEVLEGVNDPRLRPCLDVRHLNCLSKLSAEDWIKAFGKSLAHVHLHNNHKDWDTHSQLYDGTLDLPKIIEQVLVFSPDSTFTLELMDAAPSINWLMDKGIL